MVDLCFSATDGQIQVSIVFSVHSCFFLTATIILCAGKYRREFIEQRQSSNLCRQTPVGSSSCTNVRFR
jgi:hypothetical protein